MKKITLRIACLMLIWFVVHVIAISIDGLTDEKQQVDAGVVLGNKVETDGRPSERLRYRLEKAVELYQDGYFPYIIVSGGVGAEGFDEAKVMKQYLVQKGIPSDKILTDSMGVNSMMTAQNTRKIADDMGLESVMVITQFYHISRTKLAFSKLGFAEVYSAHANYFEVRDVYSLFREFFAYYKYLIFE
ncbi:YdcF family protein [Brevibacillus sp. B_LB10_24]|uniref:YdcF family protein n=1 Tax=Brevibacillus sp. B_LB10_24 TaxID=3380645 RepID=UPI0038B85285